MAKLKYDITPSNAPRFANDIVNTTKRVDGIILDYSVASLQKLDGILGRFHTEGVSPESIAAKVFGFGCYVGEVFVRNAGAKWRMATQEEIDTIYGVPLILMISNDTTANPIGKVINQLTRP